MMAKQILVPCSVCNGLIHVIKPIKGQLLDCPKCSEIFRLTSLDPLGLSYAYDFDVMGEFFDEDYPRR